MLAETIIYKSEVTTLVMLGIGILAMIAGTMMARKKTQPNDDRPETYASRGAFIPFVIGKRRVGSVVLWIEPDANAPTDFLDAPFNAYGKGGAGKGISGTNYEEQGLHALCIGPASVLHAIYQNGDKIWEGPITPDTHPSHTQITTASEGSFRIYWGFQDDQVVDLIGSATNFGVPTRLPLVTKILWDKKKLGSSRAWPRLEYEVEVPCYSVLGGTAPIYSRYIDENVAPPLTWAQMADRGLANALGVGGLGGGAPVNTRCEFDVLMILDAAGPEVDVVLGIASRVTNPNTSSGTSISWTETQWMNAVPAQPVAGASIKKGDIIRIFGSNAFAQLGPLSPSPVFTGSVANLTTIAPGYVTSGDFCRVIEVQPATFYGWRLSSIAATSWNYSFTRPTTINANIGQTINGLIYQGTRLRLRFRSTLEKKSVIALSSGTYKAVKTETLGTSGVNPAHIVSQLLFAPFPYGAHLDKRRFDLTSLEEVAEHFETTETYYSNLKAVDGEDMSNVLSRILTDIGMFISWEPLLGKYVFQLIRNPDYNAAALHPEIKAEMLLALPELETVQGTNTPDKVMVSFQDAERNYRDNNITYDDDGQASQEEVQYAEKIEISTTTDYQSASLAGYRRQMELVANQTSIRLETNHATRWMYPGLVIRATAALDDDLPLRIVAINRSVNSGKNEIECVVDNYDAPLPSTVDEVSGIETDQPQGGLPSPTTPPVEDLAVAAFELPRYLSNGAIKFFFPRLRGNAKSNYYFLWTSRDDSSYFLETEISTPVAGGFLTAELGADKAYSESATAAKIYPGLASDLYDVEDLSSQDESYFLGRQIALIGNEICFLRRVAVQIDDTWGIGELVRGRLGTQITTHPANTPVFIFRSHQIKAVTSLLFQPGRFCYAKLQPMGTATGITLDKLGALGFQVEGSGFRPMSVAAVRLDGFRTTHARSVDVPVRWNYRSTDSPKTGMGMQGFGDPVGISKVQGDFRITIYDPAAPTVIVRQEIVSEPTYTYTSANRIIDGFSDAADEAWTISVENLEAGYASNPVSKTFQAQA